MMIVDAIKTAPNEHAVYFLVTAYLESLNHFHASSGIPDRIVSLPVAGEADLTERLQVLRANNLPPAAVQPLSEASEVLSCAVRRLSDVASCTQSRENR
jgi:hypothetical protein